MTQISPDVAAPTISRPGHRQPARVAKIDGEAWPPTCAQRCEHHAAGHRHGCEVKGVGMSSVGHADAKLTAEVVGAPAVRAASYGYRARVAIAGRHARDSEPTGHCYGGRIGEAPGAIAQFANRVVPPAIRAAALSQLS